MRSVIVLLGLVALTCGHPVMTSGGDNGNELDEITRNGRQDAMLWTGSSDITAVIAPAGPLSAVAKPVGTGPTKAPVAPYKSKVVTPVNKDANGLNTRAPDGSQGSNAPAGLSSSGNSGSSPPRGPNGNNPGGQQGTKKNNSGGNNKKNNNNNNNKKNNKNKPNKDSSEEGSEESTEDGSESQESDENLESEEE